MSADSGALAKWTSTVLEPLGRRFERLVGSSNLRNVMHTMQVKEELCVLLHTFIGVAQVCVGAVAMAACRRFVLGVVPCVSLKADLLGGESDVSSTRSSHKHTPTKNAQGRYRHGCV